MNRREQVAGNKDLDTVVDSGKGDGREFAARECIKLLGGGVAFIIMDKAVDLLALTREPHPMAFQCLCEPFFGFLREFHSFE